MATCKFDSVVQPRPVTGRGCDERAVAWRRVWRWGDEGEPKIVEASVRLCRAHARQLDEAEAEGRAEAKAS